MSFDGKMTRARKSKEVEVSKLHAKTFAAWINASLRKKGLSVTDLEKDLADGTVLIALTEALTGKTFEKKIHPRPVTQPMHQIENVAMALEFMKPYTNLDIEPKDVVEGKTKVILGLIWRLVLNFQVMEHEQDQGNGTAAERHRDAKAKLLLWVRAQTAGYAGVDVQDLDRSWHDGLAFCALVHRYNPALLDFERLDRSQPARNLELAFRLAEEELGIPRLLDPKDMLDPDAANRPDEQCIMTYLSEFPRAFLAKVQDEVGQVGISPTAYVVETESLKTSLQHRLAEEDPRVRQAQLESRQRELAAQEQEAVRRAQAQREADERQRQDLEAAQRQLEAQRQAAERAAAEAEAQRRAALAAQAQAQAGALAEAQRAEAQRQAEAQQQQLQMQQQQQAEALRLDALRQDAQRRAAEQAGAAQQLADELARIRAENDALKQHLQQLSASIIGKLRVQVVAGRGFAATDFWTGKADPYVTLTLERQKEKTKTCKKMLDPVWNATYTFFVSDPNAELVVSAWDWERFSKDTFLGFVSIAVRELQPNAEKELWLPLQPRKAGQRAKGEICLRLLLQKP